MIGGGIAAAGDLLLDSARARDPPASPDDVADRGRDRPRGARHLGGSDRGGGPRRRAGGRRSRRGRRSGRPMTARRSAGGWSSTTRSSPARSVSRTASSPRSSRTRRPASGPLDRARVRRRPRPRLGRPLGDGRHRGARRHGPGAAPSGRHELPADGLDRADPDPRRVRRPRPGVVAGRAGRRRRPARVQPRGPVPLRGEEGRPRPDPPARAGRRRPGRRSSPCSTAFA